jgi:hypothetical protein
MQRARAHIHTSYLTVYQQMDRGNTRDETRVLCDENSAYRIHEFPHTLAMGTLMNAIQQRRTNASTCTCGRKHAKLFPRMAAHRQHGMATNRIDMPNELARIWRTQQDARDSIIVQRDFDHALAERAVDAIDTASTVITAHTRTRHEARFTWIASTVPSTQPPHIRMRVPADIKNARRALGDWHSAQAVQIFFVDFLPFRRAGSQPRHPPNRLDRLDCTEPESCRMRESVATQRNGGRQAERMKRSAGDETTTSSRNRNQNHDTSTDRTNR